MKFFLSKMSRHLERLLNIDALLRNRERQTAGAIAAQLEVSERTIRDDIAMMRDRHGAPIVYGKAKGYHYTDPDWRLPSITLSKGELFAITLGARMLENYAGSAYAEDLHSAIARLAERLPEQTWVDLQQVADEQIIFRGGGGIDLSPEIWHGLEEACREQKSVQMRYYAASTNSEGDRVIDPYLLHIYRGTNPYVIGFCQKRQAIRWFRVDRIKQLEVLNERFVRDPKFDAKAHLEQIFQAEVGSEPIDVAIWFDGRTAPYIRERRWHPTQMLEEHDDGAVTLRMTVRGMNDLKRWVLGYGMGAKVLGPPELIALVRQDLGGMVRHYNPHS
jgi:predicted DNA-binding transcriptional regulator YafY